MPDAGFHYPSLSLEQVACPVCNGTDFETLATADRYHMGISTSGCRGCGLVMTNPRPVEAAMDDFYRHHYRNYYESVEVPDEAYIRKINKDVRARYTADFLEQACDLAQCARVLDYGCGEGSLLRELATRYPHIERDAVEPGETFGAFARGYASCTVYADLDALQQASAGAYDLVVLSHVLEHILQPGELLRRLGTLLSPRGQICIDVPAVEGYTSVASLHIGHMYHFSLDSLAALAQVAGFRVARIERHHPPNHPDSIRCVLTAAATGAAAVSGTPEHEAIWETIREIDRSAWKYRITSSFMYKAALYLPRRLARMVGKEHH